MICEYEKCSNKVVAVAGKQQRRFCSDRCRKASKRAELKKSEATAGPTADELRTIDTKLPTSDGLSAVSPDNNGQGVTITKADRHIDASDISTVKALHRVINKPKPQSHSPMMVGYVPPESEL